MAKLPLAGPDDPLLLTRFDDVNASPPHHPRVSERVTDHVAFRTRTGPETGAVGLLLAARTDVAFGHADIDSLVLVKPDGSIAGGGNTNWPAYHIHHPILAARPDVVSVAHTHTPCGTPFAASARLFEPITREACVFYEDHALFDDEVQVQSLECGERGIRAATGVSCCATMDC
ncbi:MAG: class II aldolase/adducin family protein [Gammaproteobacteria bacterium]|nr:class II aldolase/adducin family protein [Gammaproteobacteria bacterium]